MEMRISSHSGMTLTEVMVSIAVFAILVAVLYPTFSFLRAQNSYVGDIETLYNRGQRVLDYLADDLKLAGMLLGPDARVPYCTGGAIPADPNIVSHTTGNPFDTLTFLTSVPAGLDMSTSCVNGQQDCNGIARIDNSLTTRCEAGEGDTTIGVDAGAGCVDLVAVSGNDNGRSLITFETLAPLEVGIAGAAPQVYYTVTGTGKSLSISPAFRYAIPANSTVYAVRQYRYRVNTAGSRRSLIRDGWNSACTTAGSQSTLIETTAASPESGGIDGLRFEFVYENPVTKTLVTRRTLPLNQQEWTDWKFSQLKAIKVWLLVRADVPDRLYTDTGTYTLGETSPATLGPYNDPYRRLMLSKTVEVKNLALRSE